jgi:hypothetical protein
MTAVTAPGPIGSQAETVNASLRYRSSSSLTISFVRGFHC